jgi:hypothetical protein
MNLIGRTIKLFLAFSVLLLTTMCKLYDQDGRVTATNGLSCQNYTEYGSFEEAAECSYICPDGTIREPVISGKFSASSSLYSASKEELDAQFCPGIPKPTPTEFLISISPTALASPTAEISPTPPPPLLTGEVTSCDQSMNLINFRMVESAPDLTGKTLKVLISEQESTCTVNPINPSLLTCTTAAPLTFPIRVVVHLEGAVVNDFTTAGLGCLK